MTSKAVLITGCSTGIGRATAQHLASRGHTVYASARREDAIADLKEAGCKTLQLDVTDEASMQAAVDHVVAAEGAVGVLVNNGLLAVGRARDDRHGGRPASVRHERLRAHAHVPARAPRDARAALGTDR